MLKKIKSFLPSRNLLIICLLQTTILNSLNSCLLKNRILIPIGRKKFSVIYTIAFVTISCNY